MHTFPFSRLEKFQKSGLMTKMKLLKINEPEKKYMRALKLYCCYAFIAKIVGKLLNINVCQLISEWDPMEETYMIYHVNRRLPFFPSPFSCLLHSHFRLATDTYSN